MRRAVMGVIFFILIGVYGQAEGAIFNVSTPAEFQDALTTAQSNGEDDTIYVAPGTYTITTTLTYTTDDGDGSLTIEAEDPLNPPVLDGGGTVQILNINNDADDDDTGDAGADITVRGLWFQSGNSGYTEGGGLHLKAGGANIVVEDSVFDNNHASSGGGVYVDSYNGVVTLMGNIFTGNSVSWGGGGAYITQTAGTVNFMDNTLTTNTAGYNGGGVRITTADSVPVTIMNNRFEGNSSGSNGGGAAVTSYKGTLTYMNNIFTGNSASYGGGARTGTYLGILNLVNNTFWDNTAEFNGGGIYIWSIYDTATLRVYNDIIWGNTANSGGDDGDDLYIDADGDGNGIGSIINLYNSDLGQNADFATARSEDLFITYTDGYLYDANITGDPLLNDPAGGDFHLQRGSPCIDAGSNSAPSIPAEDFEGDSRIIDGDGDSDPVVDIGADEYLPLPAPDIKVNNSDGPVTLSHGDPLVVTISLDPGIMAGSDADWWVVAKTPSNSYYFYDYQTGEWSEKCPSCPPMVSYQGPLVDVGPYQVLDTTAGPQMFGINTPLLPAGIYTLYFGVDMDMDGLIDMDQMYYDTVEVNIQ
jgi:hypothetical protein